MAKEVGLKIKISSQGGEKVISNLQDLETQLDILNNQLKTQDFGSEAFKQTTRSIQQLKTRIEDVDKATEGFGIDKRLQAIAGATNVLTGSFQALTSSVALLSDNEDTLKEVQEAEAQALQVLNVALGVRAAVEGVVQARLLSRISLEEILDKVSKSYITTAKALSSALNFVGINAGVASTGVRVLTTSLFALGIPALVAGIGLLASKFFSLGDETKKAALAQKEYNDAIRALDIENVALTEGDLAANRERLADVNKELADIETRQAPAREELRKIDELSRKQTRISFDERKKLLNDDIAVDEKRRKELVNSQLSLQKSIKLSEEEITKKQKEENKKRTDDNIKALDLRIKQQRDYFDELQKLLSDEIGVQAEVLTKVEALISKQEELINRRNEFAKSESDKLFEELDEILFEVIPSDAEAKLVEDAYLKIFTALADGSLIPIQDVVKNTRNTLADLINIYNETNKDIEGFQPINTENIQITKEAENALVKYFNRISRFANEFSTEEKYDNLFGDVFRTDEGAPEKQAQIAQKLLAIIRNTTKDLNDETLFATDIQERLQIRIQEVLGLRLKDVEGTEEQKKEIELYNTKVQGTIDTLVKFALQQSDIQKKTEDVGKELAKQNDIVAKNENALNRLGNRTQLTAEEFENLTQKLKSSFSANEKNFQEFISRLINNTDNFRDNLLKVITPDQLVSLLSETSKGLENITFKTQQELQNFISFLQVLQLELGNTADIGEDGFSAFNEIIETLINNLKKLKSENDTFLDGLTDIANKILEVYGELSGRISNIIQQNNALLFEQLRQQEEGALAVIGNATEREQEEQLKLQREFAKKRFDLEKKARIQELQFTLANSIAGGAQAVIQALGLAAPPPLPQLYAGVIAGLTGIEVATINSQIRTTQASAFVGRRGGLIQGGTHEEGGVPALLEGGEFVMSRPAVDRFGDIVGQLNQSVGGRGLEIDDSRIVQAISSQNSTKAPIKTYVLYQDIQNTDKLNKRIEKLSRL